MHCYFKVEIGSSKYSIVNDGKLKPNMDFKIGKYAHFD